MPSPSLTLKALGGRLKRRPRAWQNRLWARRAWSRRRPAVSDTLPEPVLLGDAAEGPGDLAEIADHLGAR